MGLAFWDAALRGAAIALYLLLALAFARDWRRALTARLGTVLTVSAACYVALLAVDASCEWPWWRAPLHIISLSAPAWFWLFASSWFDDDFELRGWHWAAVAILVGLGLVANHYFAVSRTPNGIGLGWRVLSIGAVVLGLRAALRGRASDLVESRRRIRLALATVAAVTITWIVVAELGLSRWPPPENWRVVNAAGLFGLAATVALATLGWRDPTLVVAPPKPNVIEAKPEFDDSPLLARLDADMRRERLYRQDGLTITAVAARLGVPEYRLRRAINTGLGARNFNAYLNGFRLAETRLALGDPAQREVPILTIALDAGFGSLAPFNRAFREVQGCTPTEYRAQSTRA